MRQLIFVTGNQYKFENAKKVLESIGIDLIQKKIETPEIQSLEVEEIAIFSAGWAAKQLNSPVVVTDTGYYFEALNGFPGPFVKYINQWLTAEDLIALLQNKTNRNAHIKICLSYCQPGNQPIVFKTIARGALAKEAGQNTQSFPVDRIFIPEGYDKPISDIPQGEMDKYWMDKEDYWEKLVNQLQTGSLDN